MRKTNAFTLVELLVVIAIIGILIGMLLPAIQQVREASRRTSCSNNVRNIALATLNYESAYGRFPRGWLAENSSADPGYGWMSYSLPFVEQDAIFERINFDVATSQLPEDGPRTANFGLMFCPSSSQNSETYLLRREQSAGLEIGRTHYVGSVGSSSPMHVMSDGSFWPSMDMLAVGEQLDGIFYENSRTDFAQISDGSSNTILLGERSGEFPPNTTYMNDETFFDSSWLGVVEKSEFAGWRVIAWTGEGPKSDIHAFAAFNSDHSGVTVISYCDGSVHMIPDSIEWDIFRALGTIAGSETIEVF